MRGRPKTEVAGAYWADHGLVAIAGGFVADDEPTADLLFYSVQTNEWTRGPDLPGDRDHAALAVLDGSLYLVGGFTKGLTGPDRRRCGGSRRPTDRGPRSRACGAPAAPWAPLLSTDGSSPQAAWTSAATSGAPSGTTRAPTPGRAGPELSRTRQHFALATQGRTVYASVVGLRTSRRWSGSTFATARPSRSWRPAPSLRFSRSGNAAAVADGVLCTAGGEEDTGTIAPIECLQSGRWRRVADLSVPRHGLAVVGIGRELHVIAGGPQPGFTFSRVHEVLEVPQNG